MDPDRLPEEKTREMTIELGFAWFNLSDDSEAAIVDVPGHERFVDAMITGVGSIDLVMFIVAADDGWMPQSQEHLEILQYLGTRSGFIVITKTDMVKEEWLELVVDDIAEKTKGTFLENKEVFRFSAVDNSGLDQIRHTLESRLKIYERVSPELPRLYVDRVFSMSGHGTVVTGTMRDGVFSVGDEIRVIPQNLTGRIKSIQTHLKKRDHSEIHSRVALNLSGISHNDLSRGSAITRSDLYAGTVSIAAHITVSPSAKIKLTHNRIVKLLIGTIKTNARAFVFKDDLLNPGSTGICEFHFEEPVLARIGDRFIIRLPTPDVLIGGGVVLDTDCTKHSRTDKAVKRHYERMNVHNLHDLVTSAITWNQGVSPDRLLWSSNYSRSHVAEIVKILVDEMKLVTVGNQIYTAEQFEKIAQKLLDEVKRFHEKYPARRGVPKAELVSKSGKVSSMAELILDSLIGHGELKLSKAFVCSPGFSPKLKPDQERLRQDIIALFTSDPSNPPSRKQIESTSFAMKDIVAFMLDSGELVDLPGGFLLMGKDFDQIRQRIVAKIKSDGKVAVADVRELFGFSRKYGVPILEKLDSMGVTRRVGDHRELLEP